MSAGRSIISILLVYSVLLSVIDIARAGGGLHQCKGIRTKRHALTSMPPKIDGSWFSPRCEMLPGPQYLLRQYEFFSTSNQFVITRYYYSDEFCREVSYAIQAHGTAIPESKSWYLNEATDMDIELTDVMVKPYTTVMSRVLKTQILRVGCVYTEDLNIWNSVPYQKVHINSTNQKCLQSLSFSINELLVMRQVDYYHKRTSGSIIESSRLPPLSPLVEKELQLGNGVWFSLSDRPNSYQPPLYSLAHKHCETCDCIYRADIENPPIRCHGNHVHSTFPYNITGHWFSQTCESVPYSMFTLRSYQFNETDSTFNITTYYFTDAFCTQQSFTIEAMGTLVPGQLHSRMYNTRSYQLKFQKVSVGVLSDVMLQLLQLGDSASCGHVTNWEMGKGYDVTNTGGCSSLGLNVHDSEFVLIKMEQHHSQSKFILLSEMKSDPLRFEDQVTHFTPKLKNCDNEPVRWVKRSSVELTTFPTTSSSSQSNAHKEYIMCMLLGVIISHFT